MDSMNDVLNRQVNRWTAENESCEHGAEAPEEVGLALRVPTKPILTVSRQHACRGTEFCRLVAHELGYGVFDRNIIDRIVQEHGVHRDLIESLDTHTRSRLETWVNNLMSERTFEHHDELQALDKIVKAASLQGGVVILGRGANYLLPDSMAYRIRIVAPDDIRVRNLTEFRGLSRREARQRIEQVDLERAQFVKKHFKKDLDNACDYDLILNLGTNTLDAAVKITLSALRAHGWAMDITGGDKRKRRAVLA